MVGLLLLLLAQDAVPAQDKPPDWIIQQSYKSTKSIADLEKCLIQELSDLGDPTLMQSEGSTTLMIRNGENKPLLVDITPPDVMITTKAPYEIQVRVKRCV